MRRAAVVVLITAGVLCGVFGVLSVYIRDAVLDSDEAAARGVEAMSRPQVRSVISRVVVDQLVTAVPNAVATRPVLEQVVSGVLGVQAFTSVYESAVRDLHGTVFRGDTDTLTVRLTDMVLLAKTQATALNPDLGAMIPDNLTDTLINIQSDPLLLNAVQVGNDTRILAFVLPLAALIAFVAAVFLAVSRGRALVGVGFGLISIGIITIIVERIVGLVVIRAFQTDELRDVARVFWEVYAGGLTLWALVIAGAGAVLVAAVWWRSEPIDITARLGQLRRFIEPPARTRQRLLWIAGWAIVGILMIAAWQDALRVIVTLFGVVFLVNALGELLRMIAPEQVSPTPNRAAVTGFARSKWALAALGILVAAGVIVGGYFAIARSGGSGVIAAPTPAAGPDCNGYALLCGKRFDQITIAATHNSMSSAEDGFVLANHSRGIIPQLDAGYRGLLIDLYYGIDSERTPVVVTDIAPPTPEQRANLVEQLGEATVRSSEELRQRNLDAGGQRRVYLCHALCEIGATLFSAELERLRGWLEANPGEVLLIIIEDNVSPADISAAFDQAGLTRYAHTQPPGAAWPTLRQMIDSGQRLVVMAERNSQGVPWLHDAFAFTQETPFTFDSVDQFSCAPNRGNPNNPLFMINHWVTPAAATAADSANTADALNRRIAACRQERARPPNIIGIDFYARGDTLAVVNTLNGVQ